MAEKCKDAVCSETPKLPESKSRVEPPKVEAKPRKIQMLSMEGCPHCDTAKTRIGPEKMKGIEEITPNNPNFFTLQQKFNIDGTPTFILDDQKACDLDPKKLSLNCNDGEEVNL